MLRSKAEGFPPLSLENVVLLRLTRFSTEIRSVLQDAPSLKGCHARVAEAQCQVFPAWAHGACLLVPLTKEQVDEAGIELHAHNIVALGSDKEDIEAALASMQNRKRPKLRPEHQACISPEAQVSEHLDEELDEACKGTDTIPIQVVVERTFVHFQQTDISQASDVTQSAPCGYADPAQFRNPRRWKKTDI